MNQTLLVGYSVQFETQAAKMLCSDLLPHYLSLLYIFLAESEKYGTVVQTQHQSL